MSRIFKNAFIFIVGIATVGFFQVVNADWRVDSDNDVVISLQTDPMTDPERACLAVTFARMLIMEGAGELPHTNVTLFVTLDGVTLADESVLDRRRFKRSRCETPFPGQEEISLKEHLEAFLDYDAYDPDLDSTKHNMVVCPLCWNARYGEDEIPDYGTKAANVKKMIFNADKILDF